MCRLSPGHGYRILYEDVQAKNAAIESLLLTTKTKIPVDSMRKMQKKETGRGSIGLSAFFRSIPAEVMASEELCPGL